MELANRPLLVMQIALGLVAWGSIAIAIWPHVVRVDRVRALRWLVAPQMFRYIGLTILAHGVAGPDMPASFASWLATGDLVTSLLAIAAFVALGRRGRAGVVLAGVVSVVGAADLVHNLANGVRYSAADHFGAMWPLLVILVPGMLVAHLLAFARLRRA